jgi:hypothetical protein
VIGQRVSGEDDIDISLTDQCCEMLDAAGVNDHRPGDDGDAAASRFDIAHHLGDARHAALDTTLGRDVVAHEREAQTVALAKFRCHADAGVTTHHGLTGLDVPELATSRGLSVDDDHGVHPLAGDFNPLSA